MPDAARRPAPDFAAISAARKRQIHRGGAEDAEMKLLESDLTERIIGAAIEVHKLLDSNRPMRSVSAMS